MLTLAIENTDDNDKEKHSYDNESDNGYEDNNNNNNHNNEKFDLLTFAINTLNLQKHFATVPSIKVDCKRIPLHQVSFQE